MKQTRKVIIILIAILSVTILGFALSSGLATAQSGARGRVNPYARILQTYRDLIDGPSLEPTAKANVQVKLQPLFDEATQVAATQNAIILTQGVKPKISFTPAPIQVHKLPDGIDNQPIYPLFSYRQFRLTNAWRKTVENHLTYLVYAGALQDDRSQGIVYMEVPGTAAFQEFLTPTREGALKIIGEEKYVLTMVAESGTIYSFDVRKMRFADSKGDPLPSHPTELVSTPIPIYP
jgi:hypothetical protein